MAVAPAGIVMLAVHLFFLRFHAQRMVPSTVSRLAAASGAAGSDSGAKQDASVAGLAAVVVTAQVEVDACQTAIKPTLQRDPA